MKRRPPDPRSPKENWDEQHQMLGTIPHIWVSKADELFAAFQVIVAKEAERNYATPGLSGVAYMLAGFTIEVLLKALLVQSESRFDADGNFKLRSHALRELANQAKLSLSADENKLLERLEEYLKWAGRYPIPLTSDPMRPRAIEEGFAPITYHRAGEDWHIILTLVAKLKEMLPKICYDKPSDIPI